MGARGQKEEAAAAAAAAAEEAEAAAEEGAAAGEAAADVVERADASCYRPRSAAYYRAPHHAASLLFSRL